MKMPYRERWQAEIAATRRVLAGLAMKEERKWGKPCYTLDGTNVVLIQPFKETCALSFFKGALLKADTLDFGIDLGGRVPFTLHYYLVNDLALIVEAAIGYTARRSA